MGAITVHQKKNKKKINEASINDHRKEKKEKMEVKEAPTESWLFGASQ